MPAMPDQASPAPLWNESDVPTIRPSDLLAALSLWLARERQGVMLVTETLVSSIEQIEAAVIEMHENDPSRGLSVLLRLRSLIEALGSRRFRHLVRGLDHGELPVLVAAAASQRLNAGWGFSPVRLSWAIAGIAFDTTTAVSNAEAERLVA